MTWRLKVCPDAHEAPDMSNSNGRKPVGTRDQSAERSVVRVYEWLSGQNRWTGVAYDAVTGSIVATASSGTRAATRDALERAMRRVGYGYLDEPRTERRGRWTRPLPQTGLRQRDPVLRQVQSLLHSD